MTIVLELYDYRTSIVWLS